MNCTKCGKILDDDVKICDRCGTILENTEKLSDKQAKNIFSQNINKVTEFLEDMTETNDNAELIKNLIISQGKQLKGFATEDELRDLLSEVFGEDEIAVLLPTFFNEVDTLGNNIFRYQKNFDDANFIVQEEGPVLKVFLKDIIETVKEDMLMKRLKSGNNSLKDLASQNFDDASIIKDILKKIDVDGSGSIDRVEFFEYLSDFFELEVADDYTHKFFEEYDPENIGSIHTNLGETIFGEAVVKDDFSIDNVLNTIAENLEETVENKKIVSPIESDDEEEPTGYKIDPEVDKKTNQISDLLNTRFLSFEESSDEPNVVLFEEVYQDEIYDESENIFEDEIEIKKPEFAENNLGEIESALEDLLDTKKSTSENIDDEFNKVGRSNIENIFDDLSESENAIKGETLADIKTEVVENVRKDLGIDEEIEEKPKSLLERFNDLSNDTEEKNEEVEIDKSGFDNLENELKALGLDNDEEEEDEIVSRNVKEQFEKMDFFKGFDDLDEDNDVVKKPTAPSFYDDVASKKEDFEEEVSLKEDFEEEVSLKEDFEDEDLKEELEDDLVEVDLDFDQEESQEDIDDNDTEVDDEEENESYSEESEELELSDDDLDEFLSGDSFFDDDELDGVDIKAHAEAMEEKPESKEKVKSKQDILNDELENFQDQIDKLSDDAELEKFLSGENDYFDDEELEFTLSKIKKDMVAQQLADKKNQKAFDKRERVFGIFKKLFVDVKLEIINFVLILAIIISVVCTLFIFYEPRQDLYYANYSENALIEYERTLRKDLYSIIGSQQVLSDVLYEYMAGEIDADGAYDIADYHKNLTMNTSDFFLNRVYKEASEYTFALHEYTFESAKITERAINAIEKNEKEKIPQIIDDFNNLSLKDYNITAKRRDFLVTIGIDAKVDFFEDFYGE
ncbi:MAG: hypothetical protein ACK5LY_03025 [Lachnospirales bacterium]